MYAIQAKCQAVFQYQKKEEDLFICANINDNMHNDTHIRPGMPQTGSVSVELILICQTDWFSENGGHGFIVVRLKVANNAHVIIC